MATLPKHYLLENNGIAIPYSIWRSNRRSIHLSIMDDLSVQVKAPSRLALHAIQKYLLEHTAWILNAQKRFSNLIKESYRSISAKPNTFLHLGVFLSIENKRSMHNKIYLSEGNALVIESKKILSQDAIQKHLARWERDKMAIIFEESLERCYRLFKGYSFPKPRLVIRKMKASWGRYASLGRITVNRWLIKVPEQAIDCIMVHELCHCVHFNHSKNFYALKSRIMPDWKVWQKKLTYFWIFLQHEGRYIDAL